MIKPNAAEFLSATGCSVDDPSFTSQALSLTERLKLACLLVTMGERGVTVFTKDKKWTRIRGHEVDMVDVTGAGDSAMAGYVVALALGRSHLDAARYANSAGAMAVTRSGTVCVNGMDFHNDPK